MRTLFNYFRQVFCKHEFEVEIVESTERDIYSGASKQGEKRSLYCPKCGYHSWHWKSF